MRSLRGWALVAALMVATTAIVVGGGTLSAQTTLVNFFVYVTIAVGIQTFMGTSGVVSFGHVAFAAIGAYAASILVTEPALKETVIPRAPSFLLDASLGFVPATLVAGLVAAGFALLIGIPIVRLSDAAAPLATLGLLVVVSVVLTNITSITNGVQSFYGMPTNTTPWSACAFAAAAILAARLFRDSQIGARLRASRDDEAAARASGVDVYRLRLVAWVASAAIVGVGGALYAQSLGAITPSLFVFDLTFIALTIMVIGGQSASAVVVGGAVYTGVTELLRDLVGGAGDERLQAITAIGPGVLVLIVLALRPQGLLGRWELDESLASLWRRLRSRSAASGQQQKEEGR